MENDFGSNKTRENVPRPIDEVFNEPRQILLPPVISWKDGSSIVFTSIGSRNSVPLYTAKLYFCDSDGVTKERNLTTILVVNHVILLVQKIFTQMILN
jgi:hypothetical protein